MSTFSTRELSGNVLFEISYNSDRYLQYYLGNFTFVPDEDLRDWDFFAEVKSTIDELKIVAQACAATLSAEPLSVARAAGIVIAQTGAVCPQPGFWVACRDLEARYELSSGEKIPDVEGKSETWVRVGEKA